MAKPLIKSLPNFNGGELDPAMLGRVDVDSYFKSVAKARNCYSLVTGGMVRRPGLQRISDLHKSDPPALAGRRAVFIPFLDGGIDAATGKLTGALITIEWDQIKIYNVPAYTVAATITDSTYNGLTDDLTWTQQAGGGNIILFHPNLRPRRLSIVTGTWALTTLSFESIPQHHFEDTTGGSVVSHVEHVHLINFSAGGTADRFTLFVDGVETGWIAFSNTSADVATNIKTELEALPNIGAGDVTAGFIANGVYSITLAGTVDGRRFFFTEGNIDDYQTTIDNAVLVYTETKGSLKKEDIWSGTTGTGAEGDRGWPRCGAFFGNRLYMAGSPALANGVWGSRFGNAEDFIVIDDPTDGSPIQYFSDTDQGVTFNQIFVGRHLQFFASGTEFYAPLSGAEPLTPTNFELRAASSIGAMRGAPAIFFSGSTLYLQRDGRAIRRFIFDEAQQNYRSFDLSLRGGHLLEVTPAPEMTGDATFRLATLPMRQIALQKSKDSINPDRIYVVTEAGDLVCICVNDDEGVLGWHLWQTQGLFSQVAVVGDDVFVGVFRDNDVSHDDDEPVHFIERFDSRLLLDSAAFDFAPTPGDDVSSDMTYLEADTGETNTVEKIVDGVTQGTQDFTEADTIATFDPAAQTDWQVGLPFPDVKGDGSQVWVQTLPIEAEQAKRVLLGDEKSVARVILQLLDTGSIKVNGEEVPLSNWTEAGDLSLHRQTGVFEKAGEGVDKFGQIDITQSKSDHMHILSARLDVNILGD